jgi:K+-transporting ATPase KdpF subunit
MEKHLSLLPAELEIPDGPALRMPNDMFQCTARCDGTWLCTVGEKAMTLLYWIGGAATVLVFAYLVYALLRAEKF